MPSERSLYSKISVTIQAVLSGRPSDPSHLEGLLKKNPVFSSRRYDKDSDEFVSAPSQKMARRVVRLCVRLGLLDDSGSLTPVGRRASVRSRFDETVAAQVLVVLTEGGADANSVNKLIQKNLTAKPPTLPTAAALWTSLKPSISRGDFGRLLTLLSHCGKADAFQRRVYLSVGKDVGR